MRAYRAVVPPLVVVLAVWLAGWEGRLVAAEVIADADCLQCHGDRELTRTNAQGQAISLFVDAAVVAGSRHATNGCAACHADIGPQHPDDGKTPLRVDCGRCHAGHAESFQASVHGRALKEGLPGVATCADCHGGHDVQPGGHPNSLLNPIRQLEVCGQCHEEQSRDVAESIHGQALRRGQREAPACTDCHSEHRIESLKGASNLTISETVCSRCHASERINSKLHLPADRVTTFLGSYHGLAAQLGSTRAANCASCHGVHRILPSTDPASSIHPSHLVETCGRCHPGASENFAQGKVHVDLAGSEGAEVGMQVNRWVRRLYLGLIVLTVSLLGLHNLLVWYRKAMAARRAAAASGGPERMSVSLRIQHGLLAISFIILAASGFALKFPDSWVAALLGSDEAVRRWTHRGAALVLVGLGLYHVAQILFTSAGRQLVRDFWPRGRDWLDLRATLRFATGRGPRPGHGARFGYAEKIEYWAVIWGTIIMSVTGFMIWFPVVTTHWLPRWVIDVATTIHYYEAILACLAIVIWHFYHVMFDPDVYPLNWAFLDGRAPVPPEVREPSDATGPTRTASLADGGQGTAG